MAEQHQRHQQQQQQQQMQVGHPTEAIKSLLPQRGPSKSQVLAVVTLFPVGGALLCLAGLTLAGTLIGLAVATPVFLLFSPVLVPAALTIALAVTGFLTSGAFGITALSSLSWIINYMRRITGPAAEQMEHAKRRVQDTAGHMGQRGGQKIQETART
ncbi:oleosin H2-like [Nicotiana tabacum]|uniref:Oleosin n=1 Tax=Nicotiana tabacum TaxID=4097 RepID=A0A1S3YWW6_TOBAC|nr:oleosin 18.2 kDa-like [Nicotiana tomentosiformis]XP_009613709.1 oleosin 18.2 kDa-like [Nicotiana tomentosiformis]XP_016456663.1 PREDICTED: oleosin 18.2 kDa-like [Nicotiana tabacum]